MRRRGLEKGALFALALLGACSSGKNRNQESGVLQNTGDSGATADAGQDSGSRFEGDSGATAGSGGFSMPFGSGGVNGGLDSSAGGTIGSAGHGGETRRDSGVEAGDSSGDAIDIETCCPDGDCICRGFNPTELTSDHGPYSTNRFSILAGRVFYPTDAQPPFAAVALCNGFTSTGPAMTSWAEFYASHGIVAIDITLGVSDQPETRAEKLLASIEALRAENTNSSSLLYGKLRDRYGILGWSLGGSGAIIASSNDPSLRTSISLAALSPLLDLSPIGTDIQVPTLLLCGDADTTAPCSESQVAYDAISDATPKMMISIPEASHYDWFDPANAGESLSGQYTLAFQKVFLEGDQRWRRFLTVEPDSVSAWHTNIE